MELRQDILIPDDFVFRLYGDHIKPEEFKAREVGKLITQLESAFRYFLLTTEGKQADDFYLSLTQVSDQSLGLRFLPKGWVSFFTAFVTITASINAEDFSSIPTRTIEQFQEIQKLIRAKHCAAEFIYRGETYAAFDGFSKIAIPDTNWIRGETILYGEIKKVGGKHPMATIELDTGQVISCHVNRVLAKQLGTRLYGPVAVRGMASWSAADYHLLDFQIEAVMDYAPRSNAAAFADLSREIGPIWDGIDDIDSYLMNDE